MSTIAPKDQLLDQLVALFRDRGYDGASLAEISELTGLGKSSLYYHFPGGKEDMARQALSRLASALETALFVPLESEQPPARKLDAMLDALDAFYEGGKRACLLERLCASVDLPRFAPLIADLFGRWTDALARLLVEGGLPRRVARARAEDCVVRIEGALVVAAGTGNAAVFARTIRHLRKTMLADP